MLQGGNAAAYGEVLGATFPTLATAANNVKGAWTQVGITTQAFDSLQIAAGPNAPTQTGQVLMDIAFGGSGSEVAVASNMLVTMFGMNPALGTVKLPISGPSGTRVSARFQTSNNSVGLRTAIKTMRGNDVVDRKVIDFGSVSTTSRGTVITPGSTGTYGTWVQVTASLPMDCCGYMAMTSFNTALAAQVNLYTIQLGLWNGATYDPIDTFPLGGFNGLAHPWNGDGVHLKSGGRYGVRATSVNATVDAFNICFLGMSM